MRQRLLLPEDRDAEKVDEAVAQLAKPLAVLDAALAGSPYPLGSEFAAADLNVASVLSWAKIGRLDLSGVPRVETWLGGCLGRPGARDVRA